MQYTDLAGNRTQSVATPAQAAQHQAFVATADGQSVLAGITSAAQIAAVYNTPRPAPNPVPQGTVQATTMPKKAVIDAIGLWIDQAIAAGNAKAQAALAASQQTVSLDPTDPVAVSSLTPFIEAIAANGMDVSAQAAQMMAEPDPAWQQSVTVTLAFVVFGKVCAVEVSDVPILQTVAAAAPA